LLHHSRVQLLLIFMLALGLRLTLAAVWYTDDLRQFDSGDYALYRIGAEHWLAQGDFNNSLFLVRPPLFPLLIALLGANNLTVLLVNAVIGALCAPLTVVLSRVLSSRSAYLAGLIVALDPASIVYSSFLGPEPLANLFLLVAIITVLLSWNAQMPRAALGLAALAGLALALSMAARPAAFMLWLPLGLWLLLRDRRRWQRMMVFVVPCAAWVLLWTGHNASVLGSPTYSTISTYNLLYYRAAAVERFATGSDIDVVYTRLSREVEDHLGNFDTPVDAERRFHHFTPDSAQQSAMTAAALEVFRAYPLHYVALIPVGVFNMFLETGKLNGFWHLFDMVWNGVLLVGTLIGLLLALHGREWPLFWCVLLIGAYFTAGTLFVQTSGMDTRMRTMLTPLMAVSTAYALSFRTASSSA
jgi:4-amino-4-deoxy-L-arabinose transferase-like glycosyltransferase